MSYICRTVKLLVDWDRMGLGGILVGWSIEDYREAFQNFGMGCLAESEISLAEKSEIFC